MSCRHWSFETRANLVGVSDRRAIILIEREGIDIG